VVRSSTGQELPIRRKGDSHHPIRVSGQGSHADTTFSIPEADRAIKTSTREQVPIRVPCHGVDILMVPSERVQAPSSAQIPELDGAIIASTGQKTSTRSKCDALDIALMPLEVPDEGFASDIPEFHGAVPAPTGKRSPIWAESDPCHSMGMSWYYRIGRLAFLPPDAYLTTNTTCCPELSIWAQSNGEDGTKGLAEHDLLQVRAFQRGILHLDALQIE